MHLNLDEKIQKKLNDIEFVESASTNYETQNALLESLSDERNPDEWVGPFDSAEDMFDCFDKEMNQEGYFLNEETGYYEKKA